jgi:N-hydroxyarylamine O-acetyltransferase
VALDPILRDAYLRRLGLEAEPPSVDALVRLHGAHTERVAWETLWIHLGQGWGVDLADSVARVATERRGGYCFHLNGAFGELLLDLGYDVTRHVGGMHGPPGPAVTDLTNHLVLTVAGLPTATNPDGRWYVDVGLGDALHEPIPLVPGTYVQEPFRFTVERGPDGVADWHLIHDPGGSFTGMVWLAAPTAVEAFADTNRFLSTSPESPFVRLLLVQRRDATGADILNGLTLRRVGAGADASTLASKADLVDCLGDLFGLDLTSIPAPAIEAVWTRVHTAHLAWEEAGRP